MVTNVKPKEPDRSDERVNRLPNRRQPSHLILNLKDHKMGALPTNFRLISSTISFKMTAGESGFSSSSLLALNQSAESGFLSNSSEENQSSQRY